jgi:hypothetical protein
MNDKMKELALTLLAAFGAGVLVTMAVDAWIHDMEREEAIMACMYEQSDCEYVRCQSVVDDEPMSEEAANACP